jgi:hypothetical protein
MILGGLSLRKYNKSAVSAILVILHRKSVVIYKDAILTRLYMKSVVIDIVDTCLWTQF